MITYLGDRCIVLGMKSAGIAALIVVLAGCGGRTSSWSPSAVRTTKSFPMTLRVSQGVMEQLRIHYVKPVSPEMQQGDVTVEFVVDTDGRVRKASAIEGDPMLAEAAIEAVKRWIYTPYILNGEPVEVQSRTVVSFGK
jgi:periplasmic protein TonB